MSRDTGTPHAPRVTPPGGPLAMLFASREARANIRALASYLLFVVLLVAVYATLFHVIKRHAEGETHGWLDGVYWTIVTMTTLGYGDITFTSGIGRLFSLVVLLSGVLFLVVMLPFVFIRLIYAPWLEARVRLQAPRQVPHGTSGHVIITEYDALAAALADRLRGSVPYFVVESDPVSAATLIGSDVSVIAGEIDNRATYERLAVARARLVVANCDDAVNTNITLTVREAAPEVAVAAIAEEDESVHILELSGATTVLPLKQRLGEYLANRVDAGSAEAHAIGSVHGVQLVELPARNTPFAGTLVRDTRLRERTGASLIAFWDRGQLKTAHPDTVIQPGSVVVIAGTAPQIAALSGILPRRETQLPVLVIGAGKVGQAAATSLKRKGLTVYAIDRDAAALGVLPADEVFPGNAADRAVIERAGIGRVGTVLLTTNDDATNIYLAVFCRRLNPAVRIVSRITHERNVEAIHRAGADFVLSYTSLGVASVMALLNGRPPVLFGEGVELFEIPVPASLAGRPLRETGIGSRTGLSVVAIDDGGTLTTQLTAETALPGRGTLLVLGSREQRQAFAASFEGQV